MREEILDYSPPIESLLESLGASGLGSHEKFDSIESGIEHFMVKKIRWIATIRNKAVHEANFNTDLDGFIESANNVIGYLQGLLTEHKKQRDSESNKQNNTHKQQDNKNWKDMSGWEKAGEVAKVGAVLGAAAAAIFFSQS